MARRPANGGGLCHRIAARLRMGDESDDRHVSPWSRKPVGFVDCLVHIQPAGPVDGEPGRVSWPPTGA